jgi:hypothetical protein
MFNIGDRVKVIKNNDLTLPDKLPLGATGSVTAVYSNTNQLAINFDNKEIISGGWFAIRFALEKEKLVEESIPSTRRIRLRKKYEYV